MFNKELHNIFSVGFHQQQRQQRDMNDPVRTDPVYVSSKCTCTYNVKNVSLTDLIYLT